MINKRLRYMTRRQRMPMALGAALIGCSVGLAYPSEVEQRVEYRYYTPSLPWVAPAPPMDYPHTIGTTNPSGVRLLYAPGYAYVGPKDKAGIARERNDAASERQRAQWSHEERRYRQRQDDRALDRYMRSPPAATPSTAAPSRGKPSHRADSKRTSDATEPARGDFISPGRITTRVPKTGGRPKIN